MRNFCQRRSAVLLTRFTTASTRSRVLSIFFTIPRPLYLAIIKERCGFWCSESCSEPKSSSEPRRGCSAEQLVGALALLVGALALLVGAFALTKYYMVGAFALMVDALALVVGALAVMVGALALMVGALALMVGDLALMVGALALLVGALRAWSAPWLSW